MNGWMYTDKMESDGFALCKTIALTLVLDQSSNKVFSLYYFPVKSIATPILLYKISKLSKAFRRIRRIEFF